MAIDQRVVMAAANNADLYEAVFQLHEIGYERLPFAFVARGKPPPFYANLTLLEPDCMDDVCKELATIASEFGGALAVKDSFYQMELAAQGFRELFTASWIWRAPRDVGAAGWQRVETSRDLEMWEAAWEAGSAPTQERMFGDQLLGMPEIGVFGRKHGDAFRAGCLGNLSWDCVGLSNVFGEDALEAAAACVGSMAPDLPIVGYESGDDLRLAKDAGFEVTGDLRILVADAARF